MPGKLGLRKLSRQPPPAANRKVIYSVEPKQAGADSQVDSPRRSSCFQILQDQTHAALDGTERAAQPYGDLPVRAILHLGQGDGSEVVVQAVQQPGTLFGQHGGELGRGCVADDLPALRHSRKRRSGARPTLRARGRRPVWRGVGGVPDRPPFARSVGSATAIGHGDRPGRETGPLRQPSKTRRTRSGRHLPRRLPAWGYRQVAVWPAARAARSSTATDARRPASRPAWPPKSTG